MSCNLYLLFISIFFLLSHITKGQDVLITRGHSHNDYEQDRPLSDALALGYTSIEVDIHPKKSELKVSHIRFRLKSKKTLEELYLNPLDSIIEKNNGRVFSIDSTTLVLMIDFKTRKKKALDLLVNLLDTYKHNFYTRENGVDKWGPVQILLSGNPPLKKLEELKIPYFFIDGRVDTKYTPYISSMITRVSLPMKKVLTLAPNDNRTKLHNLIKLTQSNNQKLRLWSVPNNVETWEKLIESELDFISVDDLEDFATFYKRKLSNTTP